MTEPSQDAVELPEDLRRYSPTVQYKQFRGQGYKPTGVMRVDSEGGYVDVGLLGGVVALARNRWEQEVRERLEREQPSEWYPTGMGPRGSENIIDPKEDRRKFQWIRRSLIEDAVGPLFGEAEPVEGEN